MPDNSSSHSSFDVVLNHLKNGEEDGARRIFERFANPLIAHARQRLSPRLKQKLDPEDVVQSVFKSFFSRNADGQFDLENWEGLWGLLLQMTIRKCHRSSERFAAQRRSVGLEAEQPLHDLPGGIHEPVGAQPNPVEIAILNETIDALKAQLDAVEWDIVTLRLSQHSIPEISEIVERSERTVARTLHRVKLLLIDDAPTVT